MTFAIYLFLSGVILVAAILGLFWAKDALRNRLLARLAYSGLIARLAVVGGAFTLLGLLLMLSYLFNN